METYSSIVNKEPINFKVKYTLEQRKAESARIKAKYPDRLPIICEVIKSNDSGITLKKNKFISPKTITIAEYQYVLRSKHIDNIDSSKGIYLFINNFLIPVSDTIQSVYERYQDIDGFLYITLATENTFGN
jgi:GABA(A) receptor-associated protein